VGGTNLGGRLTTTNRNIVLDPTSWSNALRRSVSLLQIQIVFLPLLVSIISTSIVGCKSTIVQHSEFPPSFIGSWNWIEAWVEGDKYTPENTGITRIYEFRANGEFLIFVNGLLSDSTMYRITRDSIAGYPDSVDIVNLLSPRGNWIREWVAYFEGIDTLHLNGLGLHFGLFKYVRISNN